MMNPRKLVVENWLMESCQISFLLRMKVFMQIVFILLECNQKHGFE